ncbi:MAG: hypothetical protein LQ344_004650 [Seirophora lacunosa]|nr:MAG: hypothetical protein LQ344_004650 [Seirophora lacunosa]
MRTVADEYLTYLRVLAVEETLAAHDTNVAFFSSVTGKLKASGFAADYWVANLVSPVRFQDAVHALVTTSHGLDQHNCFVEIGAHPAMSGPVRQCLQSPDMPQSSFIYHASLQRNVNAIQSTLTLTGKLFEYGVPLDWDAVSALDPTAGTAVVLHDLPAYAWDHSTKHWHDSRISRAYRFRKEPYHDLLGVPALDGTDLEPRWRYFLSQKTMPWLADHVVDGSTTYPVAGYCCMAIEGISQLVRQKFSDRSLEMVALRDVWFKRELIVPDMQRIEMQLCMKPQHGSDLTFDWSITVLLDGEKWYEHATGIAEGMLAEGDANIEGIKEDIPKLPSGCKTFPQDELYRELENFGILCDPTFTGLESLTMTAAASQATSLLIVRDVQASMPAKRQRPHVIHPSTLEAIFQTTLPLAGECLDPGVIMAVRVKEILVKSVPTVAKPGSELKVSISLASSHYHSAVSNISAFSGGRQVLSIAGLEHGLHASSLSKPKSTVNSPDVCYEMDWQPSVNQIRSGDTLINSSLGDFLSQVALAQSGQSILGLGATVALSEALLTAVATHNKVTLYDFVDASHGRFDDAVDHLNAYPVQYRTLHPSMDPRVRGFAVGAYDLVLVESIKWLNQAARLVKQSGTVLLALNERESKDDTWRAMLQKTPTPLAEQLVLWDEAKSRSFVVLKPRFMRPSAKIQILSHSMQGTSAWVSLLEDGLRARTADVTVAILGSATVNSLLYQRASSTASKDIIVVVDDVPNAPALADGNKFDAIKTLLGSPARLVWLSPDDPPEFHQIEGVARSAHAENENLRLTTIHAASKFLADAENHERLTEVVASVMHQVGDIQSLHTEREYRIDEGGTVLVPRLQYSDRLNGAIGHEKRYGPETEEHPFADAQRPLVLSSGSSALFVDAEDDCAPLWTENMIEVEVEAFALSKAGQSLTTTGYLGVVTQVSVSVTCPIVGDHVIAVAPVLGANRLRIPHTNAAPILSGVSTTTAPALLLDLMAACFALRHIAQLVSSKRTILIHGACTVAGRAAVAAARCFGIRVTATAADAGETRFLEVEMGIDSADIFVTRPSFDRRSRRQMFHNGLDAIIQAGHHSIPVELLTLVKPFGHVILIGESSLTNTAVKLPLNVACHALDVTVLIQARPDLIAPLIAESMAALEFLPSSGLDVFVADVEEIGEALRLVNTGAHAKAVLQVGLRSKVKVIQPSRLDEWQDANATYVVAGGLGDLGGRLLLQMAKRGARYLATISRTVDSEIRDAMQASLEDIQPGIRLYTLQGDVSSEKSVQAAAATLSRLGAPTDSPLESTTHAEFSNLTTIKVAGTLNLYRTFASPQLSFFLSLSSISNILGAPAQATYNAGNAVQDSLAHQQQQQKTTHFLNVNLGWIEDAGLTANDETRQNALRRAGCRVIESAQLTRFFDYILTAALDPRRKVMQAVIGFDAKSLANATSHNGNIHSSLFNCVRDGRGEPQASDPVDSNSAAKQTFEEVRASGNDEAVTDFIATAIVQQLARLISIDTAGVDVKAGSILALGLDSLTAVELRNWIGRTLKVKGLGNGDVLKEGQSVWGLAERVREMLES